MLLKSFSLLLLAGCLLLFVSCNSVPDEAKLLNILQRRGKESACQEVNPKLWLFDKSKTFTTKLTPEEQATLNTLLAQGYVTVEKSQDILGSKEAPIIVPIIIIRSTEKMRNIYRHDSKYQNVRYTKSSGWCFGVWEPKSVTGVKKYHLNGDSSIHTAYSAVVHHEYRDLEWVTPEIRKTFNISYSGPRTLDVEVHFGIDQDGDWRVLQATD